jgi:hypothetical protein
MKLSDSTSVRVKKKVPKDYENPGPDSDSGVPEEHEKPDFDPGSGVPEDHEDPGPNDHENSLD